jgi:hypothetical protein
MRFMNMGMNATFCGWSKQANDVIESSLCRVIILFIKIGIHLKGKGVKRVFIGIVGIRCVHIETSGVKKEEIGA